ncbi:MAG: sn-glycerol-3-phosphate ABC transporter ATP-binding protein UgpC [Proteobacteria bacterium]|nr:sn-glycerol-3-phosphate ABC transporter ATP-binding protein UgpC [Pseudomonadota bacterium]
MAKVSLHNLGKTFGAVVAVEEFDLEIDDGEFLVLLGPSGCGKSTTLRMIAGLESNSSGELRINGRRMDNVEPKDRGVAMVFQNYALYPHKTVFDNMAMALKLQKVPRAEIEQRVGEVADLIGLTDYLDRKPATLSGGQRQRVAIGRAIVRTPDVFLFDEPLSNLDAKLRVKMRMELQQLHNRLGVTSIYVTHDQVEAMTLADRIVVMEEGAIAQVGTPREVYDHPETEFVAGFIGSPAMNFVLMRRSDGGGWRAEGSGLALPELPEIDTADAQALTLGIRPEHIVVLPPDAAADPWTLDAEVALAELLGADALLNLSVNGEEMLARVNGADHPMAGARVKVRFPPERLHAFDPATRNAFARRD